MTWQIPSHAVRSFRRRGFIWNIKTLFIFFFSVLFISCGLEDYAYLYPPTAWNENSAFYFSNDTRNDSSVFMGFKILYRFYISYETAEAAISTIESLYNSYPTNIDSKMVNLGFNELKISDSENSNLVIDTGDRNESFTIKLDFTEAISREADANVTMSVETGSITTIPVLIANSTYVYRTVSGNSMIGFSLEDLADELDYDDFVSGTNYYDGTTYLMLFVFAFGYDSSLNEVFSEPQYFSGTQEYIEINL